MAYGKAKDSVRRTPSDKVLRDKAFKIASDSKYDGYQRDLAAMVYKFFDEKSSGSGISNEPITSRLLENINKEKYIHHSKTIFGE